jgi:hypothetical protein
MTVAAERLNIENSL